MSTTKQGDSTENSHDPDYKTDEQPDNQSTSNGHNGDCDPRCQTATSHPRECECRCGGEYHGQQAFRKLDWFTPVEDSKERQCFVCERAVPSANASQVSEDDDCWQALPPSAEAYDRVTVCDDCLSSDLTE